MRRGFGKLPAIGFARIGDGMFNQHFLFATLRHGNLDLVSGVRCKGLFQQFALLHIVREKDERRQRPVVIELSKESLEDFGFRCRTVGAGEIGAVAPVLS